MQQVYLHNFMPETVIVAGNVGQRETASGAWAQELCRKFDPRMSKPAENDDLFLNIECYLTTHK